MATKRFTVEVQPDFIERQSKTRPIEALAEIIWNGLDADATQIDVRLSHNQIGLTSVTVHDNGTGIQHTDAYEMFRRLGGSWKKRGGYTKIKNRILHGSEGVADWKVTYQAKEGLRTYVISLLESDIRAGRISDDHPAPLGAHTGVEVTVSELHRNFQSLEAENSIQELSEIFALYLKNYRDVKISIDGRLIDPSKAIASSKSVQLSDIRDEDQTHSAEIEIIEWQTATNRALYLCNEHDFPFSQVSTRFHVGEFQFSAYLKSSFIGLLHEEGQLGLAEMNTALSAAIGEAYEAIKEYFKDRSAEQARILVQEWKAENIYPYEGEPKTSLEIAERKVFDIVATSVNNQLPDFTAAPPKSKALHLRMLRTAIERSPEELQLILREVLQLPQRKQEELARLLREASLSAIISAAKIVADRLKFISALEQIIFIPEMKNRLKERSQLHKILADNTWIFGEEFNISVNDKSLTEVLRQHRKMLGDEIVIDEPVKHVSKTRGIVDLMLSRSLRRHRADELEHLVVELKAPKIKIGTKEITQIEEYAISVANDPRFRTANGVRWNFWVLSEEVDEYGAYRMEPDGSIRQKDNITIGIKTWAQLIQANKARLQFFQDKLEHEVDQGTSLRYLQEKYEALLTGVITEDALQSADEDEEAEVAVR
jgi:hypothetical protein